MNLDEIFVWLWMNPETSLCETYVILDRLLHKSDPIYQICSKMSIRHDKRSWWNHEYVIWLLLFVLPTSNSNYSISLNIQDFGGRDNLPMHLKFWILYMICLWNNEICFEKKSLVCMAPIIVVFVLSLCYGYGVTVCKYVLPYNMQLSSNKPR